MKLAFFIFKYFPFGGLQSDMLKVALACLSRGHQVDIYTTAWEGEIPARISVKILNVSGFTNHAKMKSFSEQVERLKLLNHLKVGFNKLKGLDICFVGDVCFRYSKKVEKGLWYYLLPRYRNYDYLEEAVFGKNSQTQIMLLTLQQQEEYEACYRTPRSRLHLLPPGVKPNSLSMTGLKEGRTIVREQFGVEDSTIVLLLVASYFKTKGLDRVLSALSVLHNPQFQLWVIGKDNPQIYQRFIKNTKLPNQVKFLGAQNDVQSFMLGADIFVNPARVESAGNAILEAMVMGLPIILTANCGYSSDVKEANAGIITPSDFELSDLVFALQEATDQSKRAMWSENALYYTNHEDLYSMAEKAVELIESISKR
jgi:UDP-glucose:(heptosyl)LPS alpha-1,3-glucosyltransferase